MMIIMQFAFQIILLAVGFGVGYWLIIIANNQQGTLKIFGQALGGVLIVMAVILEMFSAYYAMKISNRGYMQGGCPMNRTMNPGAMNPTGNETQNDDNRDVDERSQFEQDTNTRAINPQGDEEKSYEENLDKPIKGNKNNHG